MSEDTIQDEGGRKTPDLAEDGGELDQVARFYLHMRDLHQGEEGGMPMRAWVLADQYTGFNVTEMDDEAFTVFMQGEHAERYMEALHSAAHDCAEQNHDADMV